jgi:bacteriocin-like protein
MKSIGKWLITGLLSIALTISLSVNYMNEKALNEVIGGELYCVCGACYLIVVEDQNIEVVAIEPESPKPDHEEIPSVEL